MTKISISLSTVFGPAINIFFTTDPKKGISISELGRMRGENDQNRTGFLSVLAQATAGVHKQNIQVLGGAGKSIGGNAPFKVTPEDLKKFNDVARGDANVALASMAHKLYEKLQKQLKHIDLYPFIEKPSRQMPQLVFDLARPTEPTRWRNLSKGDPEKEYIVVEEPDRPILGSKVVLCDTDTFMESSNGDFLLENLGNLIEKFSYEFIQKMFTLNSTAATICKMLTSEHALFKKIGNKLPENTQDIIPGVGVALYQFESSYTATELETLENYRKQLSLEYTNLQKELNGMKKRIKDLVRAEEVKLADENERCNAQYDLEFLSYAEFCRTNDALYTEKVLSYKDELYTYHESLAAAQEAFDKELKEYEAEQRSREGLVRTLRAKLQQELAHVKIRVEA